MIRGRTAFVVAGILVGSMVSRPAAQNPPSRVLVLDQQARTVTALSLPGGSVAQTATLQGTPTALLMSADGQRVLVLDRGEGRDAGDDGFQAKTRSAVTILDGATLAVKGRVELAWGLEPLSMLSAAGDRLSVVGQGYRGKPAESQPREFVTVDLAGAKVLSRIELPRPATAFLAAPDGRTGVVLSASEKRKGVLSPAELRFLDLTTGSVAATVPLEGDPGNPVLSPDAQFLYLLDRGKPSDNPDKNVNGRLHVVSMSTRAVQGGSDAGSKPRGLVLDERGQRLLMLSDGVPAKGPANRDRAGELRVITGGTVSAPIPVGTGPESLETSADGKTLYVHGSYSFSKLTLPDLKPAGSPYTFKTFGEEMRVSPDGSRLYQLWTEYFKTYDLATGTRLLEVRTGKMSTKMFQALDVGLKNETARLNAETQARRNGQSSYVYAEASLAEPRGTMVVRPDGKVVYTLNSQTTDVTLIDGVTGAVIQKVDVAAFRVLCMPGASTALLAAPGGVSALDFATHQKSDVLSAAAGRFDRAELSPDGRTALISGPGGVMIVDATSGRPVGTFKPFGVVADIAMDWGTAR
ncbi:PQQ-dependent catabolism-associated beta-propeller protein [Luteitalea pratensis]|uniref:PQQ-dependent catabolism-associated beta-propeller protein n=1 Tax=Luteitalea pratensis TaxID=1855912 RepID=A0A143PKB6_LUTPR|nr:hypothetical protein [Luteitalea pratensis]AMY08690.1 PQQ-dependent catabolism-associated beta-propeller protein [Luteitalea pratensis]